MEAPQLGQIFSLICLTSRNLVFGLFWFSAAVFHRAVGTAASAAAEPAPADHVRDDGGCRGSHDDQDDESRQIHLSPFLSCLLKQCTPEMKQNPVPV
jgi:hypothetical protein